ncbi:MAG TPA: histidine phosphatase family protein [Rhizomicrobium sp.]|jgi:probable phosphoglycerate mutase|nr:histidine phosphatase family protein [Rhizomicrobium sp.]
MNTLPGTSARRRIYLMRHGHVDYFSRQTIESGSIHNVVLTPRGRKQAQAAGKAFAHVTLDRAICSGLPRTRETAELVLSFQERAPALAIDPDLVEIHGGKLPTVRSRDDVITLMNGYFARAHEPGATNLEGGEVFEAAQARAVSAIERLLAEDDWHTSLVVAHEGINRLLLSWACGAGLCAMSTFEQDTGCINALDFDSGGLDGARRSLIKAVNLTPYNYLKHGMNLTSLEAIFERDMNEVEP